MWKTCVLILSAILEVYEVIPCTVHTGVVRVVFVRNLVRGRL